MNKIRSKSEKLFVSDKMAINTVFIRLYSRFMLCTLKDAYQSEINGKRKSSDIKLFIRYFSFRSTIALAETCIRAEDKVIVLCIGFDSSCKKFSLSFIYRSVEFRERRVLNLFTNYFTASKMIKPACVVSRRIKI